jgi:AcrR family transcriptional regulator
MAISKSNKSSKAILGAAKNLFWKYGIRRVTVEEICTEAGVSKMTFYRIFKNKNEVAEKILIDLMETGVKKYKTIMESDMPFPDKIRKFIELKFESTQEISKEFFNEVYQLNELNLQERLAVYRENNINDFISFIKSPKNQAYLKEDLKPEFLLYLVDKINEMVMDDKFMAMFDNFQDAVMNITNFFFYGIIQKRD